MRSRRQRRHSPKRLRQQLSQARVADRHELRAVARLRIAPVGCEEREAYVRLVPEQTAQVEALILALVCVDLVLDDHDGACELDDDVRATIAASDLARGARRAKITVIDVVEELVEHRAEEGRAEAVPRRWIHQPRQRRGVDRLPTLDA